MQKSFVPEVNPSSELLSRPEAARYLGIAPATLAIWASVKRYRLPYIKVGRLVKYRQRDLEAFIAAHRIAGQAKEVVR